MSSPNGTGFTPAMLVLVGIPGLEDFHIWLAGPISAVYIVTLLGNCALLIAIKTIVGLHKPMYQIISKLTLCDLTLSSCVLPKMLSIFWINDGEIRFSACLIQMFFSICCLALESSILSTMAFDRYVAVCNPLRYTAIVTYSLVEKLGAASLARAVALIIPLPILIMRLPFCSTRIAHSFCETMAVAKLCCVGANLISVYALTICLFIIPVDIVCIFLSYILILRTILNLPHKNERFKAFSTCFSHICVMSTFYVPLLSIVLLHRAHHNVPISIHVIVSNMGFIFSPFMNPLIYGVTMKEIRRRVYQLFKSSKFRFNMCV